MGMGITSSLSDDELGLDNVSRCRVEVCAGAEFNVVVCVRCFGIRY